jgi:hypothetical protein
MVVDLIPSVVGNDPRTGATFAYPEQKIRTFSGIAVHSAHPHRNLSLSLEQGCFIYQEDRQYPSKVVDPNVPAKLCSTLQMLKDNAHFISFLLLSRSRILKRRIRSIF